MPALPWHHRAIPFLRNSTAKQSIADVLMHADVRIGGNRPWDIAVHDERLYPRVLTHGSLGLGEAYMDGWWTCEALDAFFYRILRSEIDRDASMDLSSILRVGLSYLHNIQSIRGARAVGQEHYNLGNDFFASMLDDAMQYSCAYFDGMHTDIHAAQRAKMELICRKLQLRHGDEVLDIGCGWGGLAHYMATTRGVHVTAVTNTEEQASFARTLNAGLPVEILHDDYRCVGGRYDAIVSVGMFEHVGEANYATYFKIARSLLRPDGIFLLHCIGRSKSSRSFDPWIERYIFPHSQLPSPAQITQYAEKHFVLEDWHNFGTEYDTTLLHWHRRFRAQWPSLREQFDERFRRMWEYYLLSCAGAFRARRLQLWQMIWSPRGVEGGYRSIR